MKWKKHGRNSRRILYYEFWDGINNDDELMCTIRYDKRHEHYEIFSNDYEYNGLETTRGARSGAQPFKTLKDAKDHCVAWLVNKRLEEA